MIEDGNREKNRALEQRYLHYRIRWMLSGGELAHSLPYRRPHNRWVFIIIFIVIRLGIHCAGIIYGEVPSVLIMRRGDFRGAICFYD